MDETKYYDGTKLLSLKDINGKIPAIYMCTSNRSAGKTTYFARLLVKRFLKDGKKFGLIYRYKNELDDISSKFFNDIQNLFFTEYIMVEKKKDQGSYICLYLMKEDEDPELCGYAFAINSADNIKKLSHLLSDIETLYMDEFQSETDNYCPKEIEKLMSIYTSIARGKGEQARYIPLYMCSNNVSLLNPYFTQFGISERVRSDTKFLRGDGWVLECNFNESSATAMKLSPFMRAFAGNKYTDFATKQGIYLNDNTAFIERVNGKSKYLCTLQYEGKNFSIKEFAEQGILYCDTSFDESYPLKIAVTLDDHTLNYVMIKRNEYFIGYMRFLFQQGCFRFKNLKCKEAIIKLLSY